MPRYFYLISIFSLLLGTVSFFAPGFIFCLILTFFLFWVIYSKTSVEERGYIFKILAAAFILRLAFFVLLNYYLFHNGIFDVFGDAVDNLLRGKYVAAYLKNEITELPILLTLGTYNAHLLTIFNGLFFALFGYDIISIKYLNIIFGLVLSWLVYDTARSIFDVKVAKIAFAIVLFWPTLFLWSLVDLKEIHCVLMVTAIIWSVDKLICNKAAGMRILFTFLVLLFSLFLVMLRIRLYPIMAAYFILLLLTLGLRKSLSGPAHRNLKIAMFIFLAGILLLAFRVKLFQSADVLYRSAIAYTRGFLTSGGHNYDLLHGAADAEVFTIRFFIYFFSGSAFHFLMEPLLWNIKSLKMAVFSPVMIIWYFLLFFTVCGLFTLVKDGKAGRSAPLLIFAFVYIVSLSMSVPNIGTLVRSRDMILPIIAIIGSYGLRKIIKEK